MHDWVIYYGKEGRLTLENINLFHQGKIINDSEKEMLIQILLDK